MSVSEIPPHLRPHTALAAVVKNTINSTLPQISFAACARLEVCLVIWVGIRAVWLVFAEVASWDGGGGLGGWSSGGATGFVVGCGNWCSSGNNRW